MSKFPEYVGFAGMEIELAPQGRITIRPLLPTQKGPIPGLPCRIVLEQAQARELAEMLLEAADQSAEEAAIPRN